MTLCDSVTKQLMLAYKSGESLWLIGRDDTFTINKESMQKRFSLKHNAKAT